MSTDAAADAACPSVCEKSASEVVLDVAVTETTDDDSSDNNTRKPSRKVSFPPQEDQLVTEYFEPANPWLDVPSTTREQLVLEYLESCRRHDTHPIHSVLLQIQEMPDATIGGGARAPRLTLSSCALRGAAPADALEAVLRKAQFREIEIAHAYIDDEGAEALFDMIEYYESANTLTIAGQRDFGIRGWQAAARMIKKSAALSSLSVCAWALEAAHAPVLARALRPLGCALRKLSLIGAGLAGEPLLCLVIALKSNSSLRELRLGDNRLSESDAAQIASLLRANTRIQLLDLSNNLIQDAGVAHIADALAMQPAHSPPSALATSPLSPHHYPVSGCEARGLAYLVLWNNQLTRNSANHISKALRTSTSLCVLNVGRNALGANWVRSLGRLGALVSLGLQAARLGVEAARALPGLVKGAPSLQRLDLRDNSLTAAGLQCVLACVKENPSLIQVDLDEIEETPSSLSADHNPEAALLTQLTLEVRALCVSNESALAGGYRAHRKISLTCHSGPAVCHLPSPPTPESERRRLRSPLPSPAPSPAGSPVPNASRFQVTRVTPERECVSPRPAPPPASPSRFRVVQVCEPPQIQEPPASTPRRASSRFCVTRNYDSVYNLPAPAPAVAGAVISASARDACASATDANASVRDASEMIETRSAVLTCASAMDASGVIDTGMIEARSAVVTSVSARDAGSAVESSARRAVETVSDSVGQSSARDASASVISAKDSSSASARDDNIAISVTGAGTIESRSTVEANTRNATDLANSAMDNYPRSTTNSIAKISANTDTKSTIDTGASEVSTKTDEIDEVFYAAVKRAKYWDKSDHKTSISDSISTKSDASTSLSDTSSTKSDASTSFSDSSSTKSDVLTSLSDVSTKSDAANDEVFYPTVKIDCSNVKNDMTGDADSVKSESRFDATATPSDVTLKYHSASDNDFYVKSAITDVTDLTSAIKYQDECKQIVHNETVTRRGEENILVQEATLVKNCTEVTDDQSLNVKLEMTVKLESVDDTKCKPNVNIVNSAPAKVHSDQKNEAKPLKRDDSAIKQIEEITAGLEHLIQDMQDLSTKTSILTRKTTDTVNLDKDIFKEVPASIINVALKKNKSESSLDSQDLEVSRLMCEPSPFRDSSSSLEISGSSMESLNVIENITVNRPRPIIIQESIETDSELDRRKLEKLSTESSVESNETPVNSNQLNMSVSSTESVSPIFGKTKTHGSLSSLEASVSSVDSKDKLMVTSADSGIEYSLQNPSEHKEDNSSNEGTLTMNSSSKDKPTEVLKSIQDTLTPSPKRTSSLLDVPAKGNSVDRTRKISWVAPSQSFHIPRPEPEAPKESKVPTNLEKLLSLFHNPGSIFSRANSQTDEERKSASNTPPRKESTALSSSFWSWGSSEKPTEKDDKIYEDQDSSPEVTDSTLSEHVQVSYIDESFSKKLDSKSSSTDTDTDNTLSEFHSLQGEEKVTTNDNIVQTLDLSKKDVSGSNGNSSACDKPDLNKPNDLNRNVYDKTDLDDAENKKVETVEVKTLERPKTFAAVLKSSGSENTLEKPASPDTGQSVDKLPSKVIRGIKENISPENTLTANMTKSLALELSEQTQPVNVWDVKNEPSSDGDKIVTQDATDQKKLANECLERKIEDQNTSIDSGVTSLEGVSDDSIKSTKPVTETVDLGKDALSYLIYENQDFEVTDVENNDTVKTETGAVLAEELREAEIKQNLLDLSPELVVDTATVIEVKSSVVPDRAKLKSSSLEHLPVKDATEKRNIVFKIPESSTSTSPRDIPERRKFRARAGSSPKSLPDTLKATPFPKLEYKKKKVSSLGKMARDSLLALNKTDEEINEIRNQYKLRSVESLRSLESVSEDAGSQSANSVESRCRACLSRSQESLMSLDSITEDCKCGEEDKEGQSRSTGG